MAAANTINSAGMTTDRRNFKARIVPAFATWTALALVILGAWLRLHRLDAMEFKRDEQEALTLAMQLLADQPWRSPHAWPAVGNMSSNGVPNPPLFTWITAALWAITRDPIGVARAIALVNVACLVVLWRWARRRLDEDGALMVLAIMAVSPFAVLFSRKIWNPDLLLPGVLALLWGVEWLRGTRPWTGSALLLIAALVFGQLHQSGPIGMLLLPIAIGVELVRDRSRGTARALPMPSTGEWMGLAAAVGVNLFFWLPYLAHVLRLPSGMLANRPTLEAFTPSLMMGLAAQIVPVDLFAFFDARRDDFLQGPARAASYYASVTLGAPLLVHGLWRWLRSPSSVPVFGFWWLALIGVFTLARIPSHPHYVLALAPVTALLPAGAFDDSQSSLWARRVLLSWRLAYIVATLALTVSMLSWLVDRGGAAGDYGVAYNERRAQAEAILARSPARSSGSDRVVSPRAVDARLLACHPAPPEVSWLVGWLANQGPSDRSAWSLCDGWIDESGRRVYRWALPD